MTVVPQVGAIHHGLDYGAAEAALRLAGIAMTPELWLQVRLIEDGAVEARNRR